MKKEAKFLIDRLDEYEPEDEDHVRDFHGHVAPAIARLRGAVSADDAPPLREALQAFLEAYGSQDNSTGGLDKAASMALAALSHS